MAENKPNIALVDDDPKILELTDTDENPIDQAHPNTNAIMKLKISCSTDDIIRKI